MDLSSREVLAFRVSQMPAVVIKAFVVRVAFNDGNGWPVDKTAADLDIRYGPLSFSKGGIHQFREAGAKTKINPVAAFNGFCRFVSGHNFTAIFFKHNDTPFRN